MPVPTVPTSNNAVASSGSIAAIPVTEAQKWASWQVRGAAHDRAVHRKMAILTSIVVIGGVALATWFLL